MVPCPPVVPAAKSVPAPTRKRPSTRAQVPPRKVDGLVAAALM